MSYLTRYESYEEVVELGERAADIRKKTVTVVGLGALGSAVAENLARLGVHLRIIDKDRVYEEDLDKLSVYPEDYVSKFKAKEGKKLLEGINKDLKIKAFHEELVKNNAYLVESDLIIECSNSLKTALLVDDARKKTPLIYTRAAGVKGALWISEDVNIKDVKKFLEKHTPRAEHGEVLPSTVRIMASLAVNKALKILTGQKHEKNFLVFDTWKFSLDKITVRKDKK